MPFLIAHTQCPHAARRNMAVIHTFNTGTVSLAMSPKYRSKLVMFTSTSPLLPYKTKGIGSPAMRSALNVVHMRRFGGSYLRRSAHASFDFVYCFGNRVLHSTLARGSKMAWDIGHVLAPEPRHYQFRPQRPKPQRQFGQPAECWILTEVAHTEAHAVQPGPTGQEQVAVS